MGLFRLNRIVYFALCLLISMTGNTEETLPPILDFYPVCEYEILDTITVKVKVVKTLVKRGDHPNKRSGISKEIYLPVSDKIKKLLKVLQSKASKQNADAIILLSRKIKQIKKMGEINGNRLISFKAELIHKCNDLTADKLRPAKINSEGKKVFRSKWNRTINFGSDLILTNSATVKRLHHPVIHQTQVSLSEGAYGVKLGFSLSQVEDVLGDPSIKLAIQDDEIILGYGRVHWFHFKSNKLVKIDTISSLLNVNILNRTPFRDFFDDNAWRINGIFGPQTSLADVSAALEISSYLSSNNELILKQNGQILRLHFDAHRKFPTDKLKYSLDGYSLQLESYTAYPVGDFSLWESQNAGIEELYLELIKGQEVNLERLQQELGGFSGLLNLSSEKQLLLYSPSLLVEVSKSLVSKIHLTEAFIANNTNKDILPEPWHLFDLWQGQSLAEVKKQLPEDAFEWDNKIEYELDMQQFVLLFEERNGQQLLYELEVEF